jgi:hypothetical protein
MGLLAAALWLAACEPAALAATAVSISLSVSISKEHTADPSAKLVPQRVRLRPGEEVVLQLELHNNTKQSRAFTLAAKADGPSDGLTITHRADVIVPRGKTSVPIRVAALPGIVPGRYEIEIRIGSP